MVSLARFLLLKEKTEQLQIGKVLRVIADRIRKTIHDGRDGLVEFPMESGGSTKCVIVHARSVRDAEEFSKA